MRGVQNRNDTVHLVGLDQLRYHIYPVPQTERLWNNLASLQHLQTQKPGF